MRFRPKAVLAAALLLSSSIGRAQQAEVEVFAFSLLAAGSGGEPAAYARVVITEPSAPCPVLQGSAGDSVALSTRENPAPDHFPITVCEAAIEFDTVYTVPGLRQQKISAVRANPSRVLIYGDTGCDSKSKCVDPSVWPFPTLASQGAEAKPDLILHLGDYNYRGTKGSVHLDSSKLEVYDAGDHYPSDPNCSLERPYYSENASDNPQPADGWTAWQLDFFVPAADLLPSAPWVFTRGNHELCSRAGIGWFYLLDAGSDLPGAAQPQRQCPAQGSVVDPDKDVLSHLVSIDPFVVNLGNLRVAVLDSAGACDNFAPQTTTSLYAQQFDALALLLQGDAPTWLMSHRPIWGVTDGTEAGSVQVINQTLLGALAQSAAGTLPASVGLSLSGHMHRYESSVSADGKRPPQIIIGNSGVALADPKFGACFEVFESRGNTAAEFGFLVADIGARSDWNTWSGEILGPGTSSVALCGNDHLPADICVQTATPGGCSP